MSDFLNKILIVDKDTTSSTILQAYANESGENLYFDKCTDVCAAHDYICSNNYDIIFIDVDTDLNKIFEFVSTVLDKNSNCFIIATSYNKDATTLIRLLRAGVKEFLLKPILQKEVIDLLLKIHSRKVENIKCSQGKVISIFSNKGGIGKTSIATNLALELANISKEKVALVDLNLQMGDISIFLDTIPKFNIQYVIDNIENVKEQYFVNLLLNYKKTNLYILADTYQVEYSRDISSDDLIKLLDVLKQNFSYIVLDLPVNFEQSTKSMLKLSDLLFIISNNNLPTLYSTQRCLRYLKNMELKPDSVKLILNRYIEDSDISEADVEKMLNKNVFWKIPNNYLTQIQAVNKGKGVSELNAESNIAKNYKNLALYIIENLT